MHPRILTKSALAALTLLVATAAHAQDLSTFGVLAGQSVTNTGNSVINGNVGVTPGSAVTGFPPGIVNGTIYVANGVAQQAQADLTTLYNVLAGRPMTQDLTGVDLGSQLLGPGVYNFNTSAQLTGTLTLTGDADSIFIFNIGSTLTTAPGSAIVVTPPAQAGNVFFRVGSSATIDTSTSFAGQIIALTDISMNNAASINCGAALARNGSVTLINNAISVCVLDVGSFEDALDEDDTTVTDNEQAVADALDAFVDGGGTLPPGFAILAATLTPTELALALSQLSGETATGVSPTGMQAMDSFLSLLGDRFGEDGSFTGEDSPGAGDAPNRGTVKALGYVDEDGAPSAMDAALASLNEAPRTPRLWSAWAAAYGGQSTTNGNAGLGTQDRTSHVHGLAAGVDFRVSAATTGGFAVSGGGTSFNLSDGFGNGRSDMLQLGVHGRTNMGNAYLTGAVAYGLHAVTTNRTVTTGGLDTFQSNFTAQNLGGEIEGGYRMGWVTPYAALRAQAFHTPAYSETVVAGVSTFALDYEASTATTVRTELGARVGPTFALHDGASLALRGRAAWAHYFGSATASTASFQSIVDGPSFEVMGAGGARDSVLLSAGAELRLRNGLSFAGLFDTELAAGSQTYTGTARVRLTW